MPTQDAYALTLVAYRPETGDIIFTFTADDVDFCEANAVANGCTHWIFTSEDVNTSELRVENGQLVPKPPKPVDRSGMMISPRQLFIALASPPWSLITPAEAVAAATTGAMPAAVDAMVSALPELEEMQARVTWARMQEVRRADPLVDLLAQTRPEMTPELIDQFFYFASNL